MSLLLRIFCVVSIAWIPVAQARDSNKATEPEQNAILTIDGKEYPVVVGHQSQIVIGGKQRNVHLEISPLRKFDKVGISFQYVGQRHFSYEKLSEQVDHWSLDGNNTIIMVQRYAVAVTRKDILNEFQKQFKAMKADINTSAITLSYKGGKLKGDRLNISLGNIKLTQDIFLIPDRGSSRTFILQDTLNDKGMNTVEYNQTKKLLENSLSI